MDIEATKKSYLSDFTDTMEAVFYVKKDNTKKTDIEYTRADAVIEKAWSWVEDNILSSNQQDKSYLYFEQFKKYMEGD